MSATWEDVQRAGLVIELAARFSAPEERRALLLRARLSPADFPAMTGLPADWWTEACYRLTQGAGDIALVCAEASRRYPEARVFTRFAHTSAGPVEPDRTWLHAHLLDRTLQWRTIERIVRSGRPAIVLLDGHPEQALFQLIGRARRQKPIEALCFVEVKFRRHGQDRGPLSAELWMRDIRGAVQAALGEAEGPSPTGSTVLVAVEAAQPTRRSEQVRLKTLAQTHLPTLCAARAPHRFVVVLVLASADGKQFAQELEDDLRNAARRDDFVFQRIEVDFPVWAEVREFLDDYNCPNELHARVQEEYEAIRDAGGNFVQLANLIEDALDGLPSRR